MARRILPAKKGFIVWSPNLDVDNGQNIVTRRVLANQSKHLSRIFQYPSGSFWGIPWTMALASWAALIAIFGRPLGVYLVCSRSRLGFLRDLLPLATGLLGVRVIVHVHGSDLPKLLRSKLLGRLAEILYSRCELLVPSVHLQDQLTSFRFRRVTVCENFFVESTSPHSERRNCATESQFVVLWNSNIIASKGFWEVCEAVRCLHEDGVSIYLVVLGKCIGDEEKSKLQMESFVEGIRRFDWANVRGQIPPEEVSALIQESNVIALPSTYSSECQPLAIIQGMIAGKPVIVTETPAMKATVRDYPVVFVDRDPASIAQALKRLSISPKITDLSSHAGIAQRRFSPKRFDTCISKTLSKGSSRHECPT